MRLGNDWIQLFSLQWEGTSRAEFNLVLVTSLGEEKSESEAIKTNSKNDLMPHTTCAEGLGIYIYIYNIIFWIIKYNKIKIKTHNFEFHVAVLHSSCHEGIMMNIFNCSLALDQNVIYSRSTSVAKNQYHIRFPVGIQMLQLLFFLGYICI